MFKTLFAYYNNNISKELKDKFEADFKITDKILLLSVIVFSISVAFITSFQYGYFMLGITGGLIISMVCIVAYKTIPGTTMCRVIMATALTGLLAISVQQSNGLGEGHFLFFIGFTLLIRYRDILPLLVFVGSVVVHHILFTYCQSVGLELWGQPIHMFSWAEQTGWGILAPFVYHVFFAVLALIGSTYYIYEGNKQFVESNLVIGAIENAAKGDLSCQIDNSGNDSLLIEQVNNFLKRLHETFSQINHVTNILATQSTDVSNSAQIRKNQANEQQNEVGQVATAVTQMAAATQEIANNAEQTAVASNDTVQASEDGGEIVNICQQSITELAQQVSNASEIISEVDRNSQQISGIVQTISSIAEQTNLLALNAAIEAARAGEQGRGFAVVANEVRILSQRTHSSTQEITSMISALQSSTQSAVKTMGGCHDLAKTSVSDVQNATESFVNIANAIKNISDLATQIAKAAEEQAAVTEKINHNTNSINEVSTLFLLEAEKGLDDASKLQRQTQQIGTLINHMHFSKKPLITLALSTLSTSLLASNTGMDLNLSAHTIAGSMGGAAYTKPQEASAAVFGNPATLTQFSGTHYNFAAALIHINELKNTQSTTLMGMGSDGGDLLFENDSISSADNYVLPTFGSVIQISEQAFLGFGLEVDAGIGANFREDPITLLGGAGSAIVGSTVSLPLNVELISFNANIAGAYQITPELSIGASVTVGFGLAQLGTTGDTTGLDELGAPLGGALYDFGGTSSSVHDTAIAASIGATYALPSGISLSAAVKSSLAYEFENIIYADTINFKGFQSLDIEQPLEAIVGIALDDVLAEGVLFEADAIWKNWSTSNSYKDVYDDQILLTFGVQFSDVLPDLDIRLGYSYAENPLLAEPKNTIGGLQGAGSLPLGESAEALGLTGLSTDIMKIIQMSLVPVIWENTFSAGVGYQVTDTISLNAFASIASGEETSRDLTNVDAILGSLGVSSSTTHTVKLKSEIMYGFGIQVTLP
jgi:methyl-accepting chemotaxis protein